MLKLQGMKKNDEMKGNKKWKIKNSESKKFK